MQQQHFKLWSGFIVLSSGIMNRSQISKIKLTNSRFTLSRRGTWIQTDKISSLKLRAGERQSFRSIEQVMSQINSVCETCWELQRSSHCQLRSVFASNCRPRREEPDLDNELLADSGEQNTALNWNLLDYNIIDLIDLKQQPFIAKVYSVLQYILPKESQKFFEFKIFFWALNLEGSHHKLDWIHSEQRKYPSSQHLGSSSRHFHASNSMLNVFWIHLNNSHISHYDMFNLPLTTFNILNIFQFISKYKSQTVRRTLRCTSRECQVKTIRNRIWWNSKTFFVYTKLLLLFTKVHNLTLENFTILSFFSN